MATHAAAAAVGVAVHAAATAAAAGVAMPALLATTRPLAPAPPPPPVFPHALMTAATGAAVRAFASTAAWDAACAAWMEEQLGDVAARLTPGPPGPGGASGAGCGFNAAVAAATADLDRIARAGLGGPGWAGGGTTAGRGGGRGRRLPPLPLCTGLRLAPYGSTAAGLASPGGDCDLGLAGRVVVPRGCVDPAAPGPARLGGPDSQPADDAVCVDVADLAGPAKATLLLSLVRRAEGRRGLLAGRAQLVLHARVPLARVVHAPTGLTLDLSASGGAAAAKMAAVGALAAAGVALPPPPSPTPPLGHLAPALVRLVKAWARTARVGDGAAGTFNSFALTLLALHHLQGLRAGLAEPGRGGPRAAAAAAAAATAARWNERYPAADGAAAAFAAGRAPLLPPLARLAAGLGLRTCEDGAPAGAPNPSPALRKRAAAAAAAAAGSWPPPSASGPAPPPPLLTFALGTFFARLAAALDVWELHPPSPGDGVAADVWSGGWASIPAPAEAARRGGGGRGGAPLLPRWPRRPMAAAIADPLDPADNTARTLEPSQVGRVGRAARAAAGALLDLGSPAAAARAWEALFGEGEVGSPSPPSHVRDAPLSVATPLANPDLGRAYLAAARVGTEVGLALSPACGLLSCPPLAVSMAAAGQAGPPPWAGGPAEVATAAAFARLAAGGGVVPGTSPSEEEEEGGDDAFGAPSPASARSAASDGDVDAPPFRDTLEVVGALDADFTAWQARLVALGLPTPLAWCEGPLGRAWMAGLVRGEGEGGGDDDDESDTTSSSVYGDAGEEEEEEEEGEEEEEEEELW